MYITLYYNVLTGVDAIYITSNNKAILLAYAKYRMASPCADRWREIANFIADFVPWTRIDLSSANCSKGFLPESERKRIL